MPEHTSPVLWAGHQAVMRLPDHIDSSNADNVREQLLVMINRGATVIIADLTATISCDFSGADALARAYRRAVANGAQLRIAVGSSVVHRVLSINGLDRLVPVYPTVEAALAAGTGRRDRPGETAAATPGYAGSVEDLLESVVRAIFGAALMLQTTRDGGADVTSARITEVLRRLDAAVQEIHQYVITGQAGPAQPDLSPGSARGLRQRAALAAKQTATLREQLSQTAHAIHSEAADTATLLERRAALITPPGEIDYATEIKRWRSLAELTEKMARRWEQSGDSAAQRSE